MTGYVGLYDKSSGLFGDTSEPTSDMCSSGDPEILKIIKSDLLLSANECGKRRLKHSEKWSYEMLICLQDIEVDVNMIPIDEELGKDLAYYNMAKSVFDHGEFDRAAYFAEKCTSRLPRFIHYFARYCSGEKKKNMDDAVDPLMSSEQLTGAHLKELHGELSTRYDPPIGKIKGEELDAWELWLYGVVLRRLDLKREAVEVLSKAINIIPYHWGAWFELACLITAKEMLDTLQLPDHWMRKLFYAYIYADLHINEEAACIYSYFEKIGLQNSTYIKSQIALVHHNQKDIDRVIEVFKSIEKIDPFRLENVDIFSNILYMKEMRVELAHLAHKVTLIDKYRMESCCVVGNYYSLRGQHEKAVQYFQRALKINPQYLAGWTLMGHEYIEMKNTNAAIQCYRQAVEVNNRDYRAWYGLGQTYEILKLPAYSIYYFKQAQRLHPNDSRNLIALGDCYEKLDRSDEAKKCFHKAHSVGDIEDLALIRLAKLYSKLSETERAAAVYVRFLQETEDLNTCEDRGQAYLFLATHCLSKNMLDMAYEYAHKCSLCHETREEGKAVLKDIAARRQDSKTEDSGGTLGTVLQQKYQEDDKTDDKLSTNMSF